MDIGGPEPEMEDPALRDKPSRGSRRPTKVLLQDESAGTVHNDHLTMQIAGKAVSEIDLLYKDRPVRAGVAYVGNQICSVFR